MASTTKTKMTAANRAKIESVVLAKIVNAVHEAVEEVLAPSKTKRRSVAHMAPHQPGEGGKCRAVWDALDDLVSKGEATSLPIAIVMAKLNGWNENNTRTEYYRWKAFRKANPIERRLVAKKVKTERRAH